MSHKYSLLAGKCTKDCGLGKVCTLVFKSTDTCENCIEEMSCAADGSQSSSTSSDGLSSGAVIGIVCGVIGALGLCLGIFLFIRAYRRRQLERTLRGNNYSGEFSGEGVKSKEEENIFGIQSIFNKADINHLEQGFYSDNDVSVINTMRATELKAHRPIIKDTTATSETIEANITGTSLTNGSSKGNSKLAASSLRSKRKEDTTVRNFDVNAPLPTPIPEESSTSKSQNALSNGFQGKIEDRFQNDIV